MTEAEWLAFTDPLPMVRHLGPSPNSRRLFFLAHMCSSRFLRSRIPDETRLVAERFEQLADELPTSLQCDELHDIADRGAKKALEAYAESYSGGSSDVIAVFVSGAVWRFAMICHPEICCEDAVESFHTALADALADFLTAASWSNRDPGLPASIDPNAVPHDPEESALYAWLLRELHGNPFRPVFFSASWHTPTVTTLARQMYETRDFSAMPILADALQDAGCSDAQILGHCRGLGSHVRGCWVVDACLNKS